MISINLSIYLFFLIVVGGHGIGNGYCKDYGNVYSVMVWGKMFSIWARWLSMCS